MIDDDVRSMTLRLDAPWSVGLAADAVMHGEAVGGRLVPEAHPMPGDSDRTQRSVRGHQAYPGELAGLRWSSRGR